MCSRTNLHRKIFAMEFIYVLNCIFRWSIFINRPFSFGEIELAVQEELLNYFLPAWRFISPSFICPLRIEFLF